MKRSGISFSKVRYLTFLFLAVLLAAGLTAAWPTLRALHLQSKGGALLEAYLLEYADENQDQFVCLIPILMDLQADAKLKEAIDLLERAQEIRPGQPHTHFLLGNAYCLAGDYGLAVEALSNYAAMRPDNPLGKVSLASAHISQGFLSGKINESEKISQLDQAIVLLEENGFLKGDFLFQAFQLFNAERYQSSWVYYRIARLFSPIEETEVYQLQSELLETIFSPQKNGMALRHWMVIDVHTEPTLLPSDFIRLRTANSVSGSQINNTTSGKYQSDQSDTGLFFAIEESGEYCFSFDIFVKSSLNSSLIFSIDLVESHSYDNPKKEDWISNNFSIHLDKGIHFLSIKLVDTGESNNRQNLPLDWYISSVSMIRCHQ